MDQLTNRAIRALAETMTNRDLLIASQESQRARNILAPILIKRLRSKMTSYPSSLASFSTTATSYIPGNATGRLKRVIGQPGVYRDRITRRLYMYNNRTGTLRLYRPRRASISFRRR